ncbi:MAG: tyrosine-type recombinase/integrase [Lachnospiraceae bacterium]|nr:tyrosine-type recombinase/integrase [Lachnospiraceae bacterium]
MDHYRLTEEIFNGFKSYLREEEHGQATIKKYISDVRAFAVWVRDRNISKTVVTEWKEWLLENGYAATTINGKLSALNALFSYLGWNDCRAKFLRIQRSLFREDAKELTQEEYKRLLDAAYSMEKDRLALLLEIIFVTGIRISEVKYVTLEAAKAGRAEINLKGKIRVILIPEKLRIKVIQYAKRQQITAGEIFLTRSGKRLSRGQIWREMKGLCKDADVEPTKVFPHNLRHLFATSFYKVCKDIVKLADVLGHSSVETTRIYLMTTGSEHEKQLNRLMMQI